MEVSQDFPLHATCMIRVGDLQSAPFPVEEVACEWRGVVGPSFEGEEILNSPRKATGAIENSKRNNMQRLECLCVCVCVWWMSSGKYSLDGDEKIFLLSGLWRSGGLTFSVRSARM